ncbi:collagen-like protein [Dawidia soli]|uniref:Uncharacterized protein n=1 Tax=Dawidia soli TaxID=2782352 RepID=A0AAP2GF46_9BACT|nr:collagen-like protein [Dawidia soli]MBT1689029.1 hypothetical protein [Dawidia soli]
MVKIFRLFVFALVAASVLMACSGEDGDPGVAGAKGDKGDNGAVGADGEDGADAAAKNGYFQGTIKGTRRDGAAFEEPFNFQYVYGDQEYETYQVLLQRFETAAGAIADAMVQEAQQSGVDMSAPLDKGFMKLWLYNNPEGAGFVPGELQVYFTKGLSATQVFRLEAKPHLEDAFYDRVIEIAPDHNGLYNFAHNNAGQVAYMEYYDASGKTLLSYAFPLQLAGVDYVFAYDAETGALQYYEINGEQFNDGALFDKYHEIRFVYNDEFGKHVFEKNDGTPLYEYVDEVPADAFAITNFSQADGVVSFDFSITISKYRGFMGGRSPMGPILIHGQNSTGHDLTITGKFNSGTPVYQEAVGRRGA